MELDKRPSDPRELRDLANSAGPQQACKKLATDIRNDARKLAPVETGRLRRGIVIEEYTNLETGVEGYAVGWNNSAFYGQLVEDGTEDTAARPHLVPAAVKHGARGVGL